MYIVLQTVTDMYIVLQTVTDMYIVLQTVTDMYILLQTVTGISYYTVASAIYQIWHSCDVKARVPQARVLYVTTVPYMVYGHEQLCNN